MTKDFLKTYETVAPMVVPRSSVRIDADGEFTLYAVATFKKHGQEFIHKCRERRWIPRDFQFQEGGKEAEQKEVERVAKDERRLWNEALRLSRTGWGESVMVWIHVLALRVFVETVLRYGLPLRYVCGLVKVSGILVSHDLRCLPLLTVCLCPDDPEARQEGEVLIGLFLFLSGRQRLW